MLFFQLKYIEKFLFAMTTKANDCIRYAKYIEKMSHKIFYFSNLSIFIKLSLLYVTHIKSTHD